jgi:hypothetical protein
MFQDEQLKEHLQTSSSINSKALVIAEWNMNFADNIEKVGNYRYRPTAISSDADFAFSLPQSYFDRNDEQNDVKFYFGATDADVTIDGGLNDSNQPQAFISKKEKEAQLYSLEECFGRFRPRSGINKARFFSNTYLGFDNPEMFSRPRFYMGHKDDKFKYWSSFRTELGFERGVSKRVNDANFIDDAAPFVVYKDAVPANRIVVKMQTGIGTVDLGTFSTGYSTIADPFFGEENSRKPVRWKIQKLVNDRWQDIIEFSELSARSDGTPVIAEDGYVEISYGLIVPQEFKNSIVMAGSLSSEALLPLVAEIGDAFLVGATSSSAGIIHVWTGEDYESFAAEYGWQLREENDSGYSGIATEFISPPGFNSNGQLVLREIDYVGGIRVVVQTMNIVDCSFDLIEISPRLSADLTDRTKSFSVTKSASDLGTSGMPVGQLLASVGSLSIFDYDSSLNQNNSNSIVSKYSTQNLKVSFYDDIFANGIRYLIPIKTMYAEGFPQTSVQDREVSIPLRDLYLRMESLDAPELFIQNVSMSYAVSTLLDSIGFSNYTFRRVEGESDPIITSFFIQPGKTVAEVLQDIAVSTQSAMFFDEYNNLVVMSKGYMMPDKSQRETDLVLRGTVDFEKSGLLKNSRPSASASNPSASLANIVSISSVANSVFNDGIIRYFVRHIQRSYGSLKQSSLIDKDKSWIYKPVLLWEIAATSKTKSQGDDAGEQSAYVLSAIPLSSTLSADIPQVVDGEVINNTIDFGEGVYWLSRYNGYFFSSGEVIRYDAAEYSVAGTGNVWISSAQEYNRYFSSLPFNGKMYPTGIVRIFSEPRTESVDGILFASEGSVAKHGRGQFGTSIVEHDAGLSTYWTNNNPSTTPVRGCHMDSRYLFSDISDFEITGAYSDSDAGGQRIRVKDASRIFKGMIVTVSSGTGRFKPNSVVTEVSNTDSTNSFFRVNQTLAIPLTETVDKKNTIVFSSKVPTSTLFPAGVSNQTARRSFRTGIMKNFMSSSEITETDANTRTSTQTGTIQSSALILQGNGFDGDIEPIDFVTYVYKPLNKKFVHFGTRMRIVGRVSSTKEKQVPDGGMPYFSIEDALSDESISVSGGSGGLAIMLNPETNVGYYFEISALSEANTSKYAKYSNVSNLMFYSVESQAGSNAKAIPRKLWSGISQIVVDDGLFAGQARIYGEENPSVYDLSVEYLDYSGTRKFFLYVNNKLVAVVTDDQPLPVYNNMALFSRGTSRVMFEHVYALAGNYSQNTVENVSAPISSVFGNQEVSVNDSFRKYAMSGAIQETYLSGIAPSEPPKYSMYFDEFGTIMREASYINAKYDRAYPALYAQISPTFNDIRGYTISGFIAGPYGAEFLVFNNTDTAINLDETTGNFLRIQGVTFTQQTQQELSVDKFLGEKSDFSKTLFSENTTIDAANTAKNKRFEIQNSRITYGRKEFSLDPIYVQSEDSATEMMEWMVSKTMIKRLSVGAQVFGIPTLQLGDIVTIDYSDNSGVNEISDKDKRFVVYSSEYSRDPSGPTMNVYLSEVV